MHLAERPHRQDEVGVGGLTEQRRLHREEPGLGARLVRGQVERRADEDVPEALDRALRLAPGAQLAAEGLGVGRLVPAGKGAKDREPLAEGDVPVAEQRQRRAPDRRRAAALVEHGQVELQAAHRARLADPVEEAQVLREAAERDVLAVVGRRLGVAFAPRQGLHRPAERRPGLVQRHLVARVGQVERGRQPGEAAADDRDLHRRSPAPTMRSFVSRERRTEPSKTSNPRASIRSSVAR